MAPSRVVLGATPRGAPLAALLLLLALAGGARAAPSAPRGFVQRVGAGFVLDGAPFHVTGANQYNLMTATSFGGSQAALATGALDAAQGLGLNVVRTWAFCDGSRPGALQPRAGVYVDSVFRALDSVVAQAQARGIRLLLVLTNNWQDYGGMQEYVNWAQASGERVWNKEEFFTSPKCRDLYRAFFTALLTRVNTVTGVEYRNDPTVFAWELINEPRNAADRSGDEIQAWIEEMSAGIKAVDPYHMVTTGVEGFFGPWSPERLADNPYSGSEGTDFRRNHLVDTIDFAVAHVWADQWMRCDHTCQAAFIRKWHLSHLEESQRLGKPFILEEFGAARWWRDSLFASTYDITYANAAAGGAAGGDLFWLLGGSSSVPDYDSYTVYPGDASTAGLVKDQVSRMRRLDMPLSSPPPPPTPQAPLPPAPESQPAPQSPPFPGMPTAPPWSEAPPASTEEYMAV